MMTDEQLAKLKERIENSHGLLPRDALALIARLEVAEAAVAELEKLMPFLPDVIVQSSRGIAARQAIIAWRGSRGLNAW